jgi:hypothetical protein
MFFVHCLFLFDNNKRVIQLTGIPLSAGHCNFNQIIPRRTAKIQRSQSPFCKISKPFSEKKSDQQGCQNRCLNRIINRLRSMLYKNGWTFQFQERALN